MNSDRLLKKNPMHINNETVSAQNSVLKNHFKRALQFEKERQSVILQSIGDGVIATDVNERIILMNPIAEKLTGWKFEAAENKLISEVFNIFDSFSREKADNLVKKVLKTGQSLKLDPDTILISRNQNKEYAINDSCAPIIDIQGKIMGVVLVFRDVTKEKQEETLKEKITSDLVQRNKDHEHFSNIISHDMRGPVANIMSLTGLANDMDLKEEEREFIMGALSASAERLEAVIDDLNVILSVGKQLAEKRERVNFSKLVRDIQDSITYILEKEPIRFNIDFSRVDEIFTIKSYMYSIFHNLISNSIKYRRPELPLEITVESELINDKIRLNFKDNGLGIDLKQTGNNMFGLYQRFHIDNAEGKGMGLYMVKMQVEKLGGTISVKSKVNEGTEFTILFDL